MATLVSSVVNYIFGADAQKNEREVEDKDAKAFDEVCVELLSRKLLIAFHLESTDCTRDEGAQI